MFARCTILFFVTGHLMFAQNTPEPDSLKIALVSTADLNNKAQISLDLVKYYNRNNPDSNSKYLALAKDFCFKTKLPLWRARYFLAEANHLQNTGHFIESIRSNETAINLFEKLNDNQGLADSYNTLGLAYKKRGGDNQNVEAFSKKALLYENRALEFYLKTDDKEGLYRVYSNIGIIQRDFKDYKAAEKSYLTGLESAKKEGIESYSVGILHANLSQIYLEYYKDYDKAISLLEKALSIYQKNGIKTSQEHAYRNIAYNYIAKGDYAKAILNAKKAVQIAEEVKDPHRKINAYSALYDVQEKAGMYKEAFANLNLVKRLEDSVLSNENTRIIAEMDSKFESVKKEAQIQVLNKTNELNKWQILFLVLLLVALGILYYSIYQKRLKDQVIFEKENQIEKERRRAAESELDSKRKELTTKVLQLAHKNEFLNSLENEIVELKNNVDSSVNKTSTRISKMIRRDIESDTQWDQFSQEFAAIHEGFLKALTDKFGNFTKSEIRLISLLKMNMNSKEIADILGIGVDGVKKARYRLRQKMNLEDAELQSFLLSFS